MNDVLGCIYEKAKKNLFNNKLKDRSLFIQTNVERKIYFLFQSYVHSIIANIYPKKLVPFLEIHLSCEVHSGFV